METSSVTRLILTRADFRKWPWWSLPVAPRCYVGLAVVTAMGSACYAASQTTWHAADLVKYSLLLGCSIVAIAGHPGKAIRVEGATRDFLSAWVLPVAILLPPVYAMITPVPLQILTHMRAQKGVIYRRAFTVAAISQCYGAASLVFRSFPVSFAGGAIGSGKHALTWTIAVAACELLGGRGHYLMVMFAVKLADPHVRLLKLELKREALLADFAEFDLGIILTIVAGVSPVLEVFAVPTVLLIRRFLMHEQLLAQSRIDTKTGLLNSSTWEAEASIEVARALRTQTPLAVALIDIDHFKTVNDTHGHLVGDKVLRAVTDAIQEHLRAYDLAGRFGGEEFVVVLPNARESDAISIAERLRRHVEAMKIPVGDDESGPHVRLTISVGVSALNSHTRELNDLMSAADAAMYFAKQSGRNRTYAAQRPVGAVVAGSLGPEEVPGDPADPVSASAPVGPDVSPA